MRRAAVVLLLTAIALAAGGCSGGSGNGAASGGSAGGNTAPPPIAQPAGRGTVAVTVKDALGAPAGGVKVTLLSLSGLSEQLEAVADAGGRVEFRDARSGLFSVSAEAPDLYAAVYDRTLPAGGAIALDLTMEPTSRPIGGTLGSDFITNKVSDDGRTFEFTLLLADVADPRLGPNDPWGNQDVRVVACVPDPGNDLPRFHPDCVSGPDGFDAGYEGQAVSIASLDPLAAYIPARTVSSALLLDQSASVIVRDPADDRLFAAKYFLGLAKDDSPVVLAAFASDDARAGQAGLLPRKPVTVFPIEDPKFTGDGRSYFSTVDQLASLEGGAAPLFAAIDRMIDFVYAGDTHEINAVIVLTDGRDDSCGGRRACRDAIDRLTAKGRAAGVQIVTVGLGGAAAEPDYETLGLLARFGATFVARDPKQLGAILGTVRALLQDMKPTAEVAFRIQSPLAGTFASGRTVIGTVRYATTCPFDCVYAEAPFVVRVP